MENIFPSKLLDLLTIAMTLSLITMVLLQNIKSQSFIRKSFQIWLLNLILSFILGIPFAVMFYNLTYIDGIWVGLFTFIGAPSIYKALQTQNVIKYKPSSLENTVSIAKENEIPR